jgi:hypothetical protein
LISETGSILEILVWSQNMHQNQEYNKMNYSNDIIERFFSKIIYPGNNSECWLWNMYLDKDGYGTFYFNSKSQKAHRFVYEIYNGQIQNNFEVCHDCDNPTCVNPNHLFLASHKENMTDCSLKCRMDHHCELNANAILTNQIVLNFINNVLNGTWTTRKEIIDNMSYTNYVSSLIHKILNRKTWKNITDQFTDDELDFVKNIYIKNQG